MSSPVAPVQGATLSQFTTGSTTEVVNALRRALLDYTNDAGGSARDTLAERFWDGRARDRTVFPYAVCRLNTRNEGRYHGMRLDGALEIQVFGKPWAQQQSVNAVCDLFDQAMRCLVLQLHGLIICHGFQRDELPEGYGLVDADIVTVRLLYTLAIWPDFLTSLTRVLPPTTG